MKIDVAERDATRANGARETEQSKEGVDDHELEQLDQALNGLESHGSRARGGAQDRLLKRIRGSAKSPANRIKSRPGQEEQDSSAYNDTHESRYDGNYALTKVAEFDSRMTFLESILGLDALPLPTQDRNSAQPILPTLTKLEKQLSALSSSSGSTLDSMGKRVRQLTQDTEKLDEARKSAKTSLEVLKASHEDARHSAMASGTNAAILEDSEQTSKINALYGTLATIESLAPLLPSVLDRLRSLRLIHADAANASQSLSSVEQKQSDMAEEIKSWREGLQKVEAVMKDGESRMGENTKVVEAWVKELEGRIQRIGSP